MNERWTLCLDAAFWGVRAAGITGSDSVIWQKETIAAKVANSFFSEISFFFADYGLPDSILVNIGPGSFTGVKLSLAFARGLQAGSTVPANQNQFKTQIYGYGLKNLWDHCLTRPDTVSSLCEKPWALPITAKKMLLCDGQGLSVKTPKDGLGQDWFVLPSLSPDALNNHYKSKDECGQVDFLSPELWSDVLKVFWVDSVQRKFAQLDENPDPDYFFGSSAEENLGVRVT